VSLPGSPLRSQWHYSRTNLRLPTEVRDARETGLWPLGTHWSCRETWDWLHLASTVGPSPATQEEHERYWCRKLLVHQLGGPHPGPTPVRVWANDESSSQFGKRTLSFWTMNWILMLPAKADRQGRGNPTLWGHRPISHVFPVFKQSRSNPARVRSF
jgi:hypothetical protein